MAVYKGQSMRFVKHGWLVMIGMVGFVAISNAKQYSTELIPIIQSVEELRLSDLPQRHCLYAGKAYSLGAIIRVNNIELECRSASSIELNGPLKWVVVEQVHKSTLFETQ